ncbi:MAG: flagellum biosynthesis protein FlbT [Rhodobacteraceae bacterium]|nr:MAG: flagellum biosynthesis protein FlbT [Paracoccaceae bacterium]
MPLRLTLKPEERIIINGCIIRNAARRQTLTIENHADVVRGHDLLKEQEVTTPVTRVYFLIQTVLVAAELRDDFNPRIQKSLAELMTVFGADYTDNILNAANFVSMGDHYKALRALSDLIKHERNLLNLIHHKNASQLATAKEDTK